MKKLDVQKVKKIMLDKNININELSKRLQVSRVTIHRYLKGKGKMQINTINNISRALEVQPLNIVKGNNDDRNRDDNF